MNRWNSPYGGEIYAALLGRSAGDARWQRSARRHNARSIDGGATVRRKVRQRQRPASGRTAPVPVVRDDVDARPTVASTRVWNDTRNAANRATPPDFGVSPQPRGDGGWTYAQPGDQSAVQPFPSAIRSRTSSATTTTWFRRRWRPPLFGPRPSPAAADVYHRASATTTANGKRRRRHDRHRQRRRRLQRQWHSDTREIVAGVLADSDGDGIPDIRSDNPPISNNDGVVVDAPTLGLPFAAGERPARDLKRDDGGRGDQGSCWRGDVRGAALAGCTGWLLVG